MTLGWYRAGELERLSWTCGYCGREVGGSVGYRRENDLAQEKFVYICPYCENPTAFVLGDAGFSQYPGAVYGRAVGGLPKSVSTLYSEVRRCVQYTAYTAAVLALRKLLMHVAVDQGAEPGQGFVSYVGFLEDAGWIPPSGRLWVDALRKSGNEAAHEIVIVSEADAKRLLDFAEMLLRLVYEFPLMLTE